MANTRCRFVGCVADHIAGFHNSRIFTVLIAVRDYEPDRQRHTRTANAPDSNAPAAVRPLVARVYDGEKGLARIDPKPFYNPVRCSAGKRRTAACRRRIASGSPSLRPPQRAPGPKPSVVFGSIGGTVSSRPAIGHEARWRSDQTRCKSGMTRRRMSCDTERLFQRPMGWAF